MKRDLEKGRKIAVSILLAIVVICITLIISIILSEDTENVNDDTAATEQTVNETDSKGKQKDNVLYSDDNFKITFIDFKDPQIGVTSYNLLLKIENDSEQTVIVSPTDGYANGEGVFLGSGMPIKVEPNKKTTGAFIVGYGNTSIKSIEEIKTLELKLTLYDEDFSNVLLTTDNIVISFD